MPTVLDHVARRLLHLHAFESVQVETSVGWVHAYRRTGGGSLPPVVFFHGLGASSANWAYLLRVLRREVRSVLAIDLPAHGFSAVPEAGLTTETLRIGVEEALDQLHAEPAVAIGNSLGGAAAIRYANARPERVLGLCLISPAGAPLDEADLELLRSHFRIRTHAEALAFLDRLYARPNPLRHLIAPGMRRRFRDPVLQGWLDAVRPEDQLDPSELTCLRIPCRVVWGQQERLLPEHGLAFFQRHLPHAEFERPEGYGHSPFLDDPKGVAERILGFLRQVAADRASAGSP